MRTILKQSVRTGIALSALVLAIGNAVAASAAAELSLDPSGANSGTAVSAAAANVSPDAIARAEAKFARAMAIADQFQTQAREAGIEGDAWRFDMVGNLMKGSEENFAAVALARSYIDAMGAATQVGRMSGSANASKLASTGAQTSAIQPKTLGTATSDLVYVPITPCRIVDTRKGSAAVPAGQVSTFAF